MTAQVAGAPRRRGGRAPTGDRGTEAGFTLVELIIAMTIGLLVLSMVMLSLGLFIQNGDNGVAMGQADHRADLLLAEIQRQVVAANVVFNPATEGSDAGPGISPGFSLRILTAVSGRTTCVQWRLLGTGALETRSWPDGVPTEVSPWQTIATGVENPTSRPPFALDTASAYGDRLLDVDLVMKASDAGSASHSTEVRASFTALDAEFFSSTDTQFCTPVPTP